MRLSYRVSRLLGSVHSNGNLVFLPPDGVSVLSAVRNRVMWIDLVEHTSSVLPFEARKDIKLMAVSHDGRLLVAVDADGRALLVNLQRRVVLHRINLKKRVRAICFSPDDRFIAVAVGKQVQVWRTPSHRHMFLPMTLVRTFGGHHDDVTCLDWAPDSCHLLSGSKDMSARIHYVRNGGGDGAAGAAAAERERSNGGQEGQGVLFVPTTLSGHRDVVRACFFDRTGDAAHTVARDGGVFSWRWEPDTQALAAAGARGKMMRTPANGRWRLAARRFLRPGRCVVTSAALHRGRSLLVVGFSSGVFGVYDVELAAAGGAPAALTGGAGGDKTEDVDAGNGKGGSGCECLHTLSVGRQGITGCAISGNGDWLAFGCAPAGQLLVWEWQAETYVLKQSGHGYRPNCLAFSPTGAVVATGGDDSKVKLWGAATGFCFVTFSAHAAPVTGVAFTANGSAVLSASLDGTVRAHDLVRYKNFRTLATPRPAQLSCLAVDPAGELVVAGSMDPFDVYVWSLQTGRLLDVLSGHEAPTAELAFSPGAAGAGMLASASWDGTVKLWNLYKNELIETLEHSTDVLAIAFRPDGKQLCAATLAGQLQIWGTEEGELQAIIEGRRDVAGGRRAADLVTAEKSAHGKYFTSCAYTADGTCVIAGGHSKFVCIYEISQRVLIKKFQISHNRSLDGVLDRLNSARMTEAGSLDLLGGAVDSDEEDALVGVGGGGGAGAGAAASGRENLPGARRGDDGSRRTKEEVRVSCVRFGPTGREWAAATVEGVLLYSLDEDATFDPTDLDEALTPAAVAAAIGRREWGRALTAALHLNEQELIALALGAVPAEEVALAAAAVPEAYAGKLLASLAQRLSKSRRLEFHLLWCQAILQAHGSRLRDKSPKMLGVLRAVQRALSQCQTDLFKLVSENLYTLRFLGAERPAAIGAATPGAASAGTASGMAASAAEDFLSGTGSGFAGAVADAGDEQSDDEVRQGLPLGDADDDSAASSSVEEEEEEEEEEDGGEDSEADLELVELAEQKPAGKARGRRAAANGKAAGLSAKAPLKAAAAKADRPVPKKRVAIAAAPATAASNGAAARRPAGKVLARKRGAGSRRDGSMEEAVAPRRKKRAAGAKE